MSFISELKRRNVIRVGLAYLAGAWLLIQIADTVFPAYDFPEPALNILISALGIGFIPILVIAWAFEWTPQGIRRDADVDVADSNAPQTGKFLDRVIMVVLALALGYFAVDKFVLEPVRDKAEIQAAIEVASQRAREEALLGSYGDKSIAVLPFVNMSPNPDQAYFADGVAEELLNLLAKVPGLRVISRSSSFAFRGDDINVADVGRKLNVAHVLEGSVRRSGDQIRVTVQLIEASTDTHLWSDTYDRQIGDFFQIQDDIAAIVVDELKIKLLTPMPPAYRTDPETYALYLQARYGAFGGQDSLKNTEKILRAALEKDPNYVPAITQLVDTLSHMTGDEPGAVYAADEGYGMIFELVQQALKINPDDGAANAYLAAYMLEAENDLGATAKLIKKALASEPANPDVLRIASGFAYFIGRFDDAVVLSQRTAELDPMCVPCLLNLSRVYMHAGRYTEAESAARFFQIIQSLGGWWTLGKIRLLNGDPAGALEAYETDKSSHPIWVSSHALALHDLGRQQEFQAALSRTIDKAGEKRPVLIARMYAWTGDADNAFLYLDKQFGDDILGFHNYVWDPLLANLRGDPRWIELRERAGFAAEHLADIEFSVPE